MALVAPLAEDGEGGLDPALRDHVQFFKGPLGVVPASAVPNGVTEEVAARLKAHWPPEAIVEITAVVALFGYLNRWNDSMGSALEDLPRAGAEARLAGATGWTVGKHA
jgi:hypothetical protein